jgi:hypothetical protein
VSLSVPRIHPIQVLIFPFCSATGTSQKLLPFDHVYPYDNRPESSAILYISTLSASQADLYEYLCSHAANDESFSIIVRYRPPPSSRTKEDSVVSTQDNQYKKNSLKGYGVELVLKRTDYLAVDDRDVGVVNDRKDLSYLGNPFNRSSDQFLIRSSPRALSCSCINRIECYD